MLFLLANSEAGYSTMKDLGTHGIATLEFGMTELATGALNFDGA